MKDFVFSNIKQFRYERKYFIENMSRETIETLIKLHPAIFREIYCERRVNNIYFDSFDFGDTLSIYPEEIKTFIDNNGFIAWGVVPTTDIISRVNLQGLSEQLERGLTSLEKTGIPKDRLRRQSIISPSCGPGSPAGCRSETLSDSECLVRSRVFSGRAVALAISI